MDSPLLPVSVRSSALAGFDLTFALRLQKIDLSGLLVTNMETVAPALFPLLAEQYDVAGYGGLILLSGNGQDEAQTRALLGRAISLHRKKGTAWAIREALSAVGFGGAVIVEGNPNATQILYDGSILYDGGNTYGNSEWATFSVELDLGNSRGLSAGGLGAIIGMINEYKPARCRLSGITFFKNIVELLEMAEFFSYGRFQNETTDTISPENLYDGAHLYDGITQYGGAAESFTFTRHAAGF